ncbi:MAG: endonuclease/exonuclease/phosphatase family protein [Planctomycetales bacterium]|nr:endonuclease/exonuclease/phosphatase family protein [Planctomycetales bacterium]
MLTLSRKINDAWHSALAIGVCAVALQQVAMAQPFDDAPKVLSIMSWNVEWMFDNYLGDNSSDLAKEQAAPSKEYWRNKVNGVAKVIADAGPQIVALQEIESERTLAELCSELKGQHKLTYRFAFITGRDSATEQDVGILFRDGLISYRRQEQTNAMFNSRDYYNLSKHLFGEFQWKQPSSKLTVLTLHLRARAEAEDLRVKQAKLARRWIEPQLHNGEDVIVLGDFNCEHLAGTLEGDAAEMVGAAGKPQMVDLLTHLEDPTMQTHLVLDKQFDRVFVSPSLMEDGPGQDWCFERIEVLVQPIVRGHRDGQEHWDNRLTMPVAELDLSDHFPILAQFRLR